MTAAVAEDDQAETPEVTSEPSARDKHLAEWLELSAAADKALREAIAAELAEGIPALEQDQARAAGALEKTYAALQGPERDLADLEGEIASAETELATWQSRLETGDVAARVEARRWLAEWETELASLRGKREFAEAQLLPLRDAHTKARVAFEQAGAAVEGRKLNATPALAYFAAGQKTALYGLRFGLGLEAVLRDRDHLEHDAAVSFWLHLCQVSGLRTEDYASELPSDAEQARRFWDQVYADANPPEPVPSARQVVEAVHTEMTVAAENKRLEASPVRIDDRRGDRPVPVPPARSYMQVPWRDAGAG